MGPVEEIVDVVRTTYKSRRLDTIERYYIYWGSSTGNQINDKNNILRNWIFNVSVHHDTQQVV